MNEYTQRLFDALKAHGHKPTPNGRGYKAHCPAHDDRKASLSFRDGDKHPVLVKCHAGAGCKFEDIVAAVDLKPADLFPSNAPRRKGVAIVAKYDYCDERGELLFQAVRYEPKNFRQRRPDGKGGWIKNLDGVRRVLYQLPALLAANPAEIVFVVEGEKDVDRLRDLGLIATCSPMGAGKWQQIDDSPLHGRRVIVLPDNDDSGRKHAKQVESSLADEADVTVIILPEISKHGDVSDWLDAGGTVQQLRDVAEQAGEAAEEAAAPPRSTVRTTSSSYHVKNACTHFTSTHPTSTHDTSTHNTSTHYLWAFARDVVRDHGRDLLPAELLPIVRARFRLAPNAANLVERLVEFIRDVKYLPGDGPWERAVAQARKDPPPGWAGQYASDPDLHFIACLIDKLPPCAEGKNVGLIRLRQQSIARELGVRQTRVSRLMAILLRPDGVLQLVHEAVPHKACALYRFHPPNRGAS